MYTYANTIFDDIININNILYLINIVFDAL